MFRSIVNSKKQDIAQDTLYKKKRLQYLQLNEDPNDTKPAFPTEALAREPHTTPDTSSNQETSNHTTMNKIKQSKKKKVIKATSKERIRFAQKRIHYLTGNQKNWSKNQIITKMMVGPDFGLSIRKVDQDPNITRKTKSPQENFTNIFHKWQNHQLKNARNELSSDGW